MINLHEMTIFVYNLALLPVIFSSVFFLFLAIISLFVDDKKSVSNPIRIKSLGGMPFVSVQIPVYNDDCAVKCLEKCMSFDYPKKMYEIIIVDDSTDKNVSVLLRGYADRNRGFIKYIHRDNRDGFKPGALQNAMKITKGKIIVLFDSDWRPPKNFLKDIIKPFLEDDNVAIVQAKQGIRNLRHNLISRFAGYLLMIFHSGMMPIYKKTNAVFFCGTGGAIRADILNDVGGWNVKSLTEDADLSVKIIAAGYKTVYINLSVSSEVPHTFAGFVKQQMRWSYGLTRVFFDNIREILLSRKMSFSQRAMITYSSLGHVSAPLVLIMTIFGMLSWFTGEPQLFNWGDVIRIITIFLYTSGFLAICILTLYREEKIRDFPNLLLCALSVSFVLIIFNSVAFFKALLNMPLFWHRTPKSANRLVRN